MDLAERQRLLDGAVDAAHRAGALLHGYFGRITAEHVSSKSTAVDLVSHADQESEALLREALSVVLESAAFIGEESTPPDALAADSLCWIVDPLDGTSNFLASLPVWSVSIALCQADFTPVLGVVHAPTLGKTWTAVLGGGARVNGEPMQVRREPPGGGLDNAMLATGFPYDVSQGRSSATIRYYSMMQARFQKIRRLGSAAIDLAYIAEGVFDGMWEMRLREWDTAAGILLVSEAGGLCTRFDGTPYIPGALDMLVAATPELMAVMRGILQDN